MQIGRKIDRRSFLRSSTGIVGTSLGGLVLAGCARGPVPGFGVSDVNASSMYAALPNEQFPIPAVNLNLLKKRYYRRRVDNPTGAAPGTVYVDTKNFYLYFTEENNKAMRYGVGLGRAGFEWSGDGRIAWKKKWPTWTPPSDMIEREPKLEKYSAKNGGMPPGLDNPLGARALYIFKGNKDTLYRLHGTSETYSIGKAVSSGCVRLLNQDVIDLYNRVPNGAPIIVA